MLDFERKAIGDVLIEKVNLLRATTLEATIIKNRLSENIKLKCKKIVVDLSRCNFIDSTFLGALVMSLKRARETGGDIKIITTPSSLTEGIIFNSSFRRVFEIYNTEADVIQSFVRVRNNTKEEQATL